MIKDESIKNRDPYVSIAGQLRSKFVYDSLRNSCIDANFIVVNQGHGKNTGPYKTMKTKEDGVTFYTLGYKGRGFFRYFFSCISTHFFLLRKAGLKDVLVCYNFRPELAIPIITTRWIKKYKLVIQFEELYGELPQCKYRLFGNFENFGIRTADAFIVCSSELEKRIRKANKNAQIVLSSGYPPTVKPRSTLNARNTTERLKILYSGTLDKERGVNRLLLAFQKTGLNAILYFTGDGPYKKVIESVSCSDERVKYLGVLPEDEFEELIERIDICVNPQPPNSKFSKTSFPSKLINYLFHGKIVMSTKMKSVINSKFGEYVYFYDDESNSSFEETVLSIKNHINEYQREAKNLPKTLEYIFENDKIEISNLIKKITAKSSS